MRKFILFAGILLCGFCASAQSARLVFFSAGYSFLTNAGMSQLALVDTYDTKLNHECQQSYQFVQWNFVSGLFGARVMLLPLTMNSSISVSATPTLNIGVIYPVQDLGSRYGMNVSCPVFAELNIGAAARYVSSADIGLVLGFGFEYFCSPIMSYELTETECTNSDFQKSWILPTAKVGFRYWSKKNKVKEIILRVGIGEKGKEFYTFDSEISKEYRPFNVGLSFMKILNY